MKIPENVNYIMQKLTRVGFKAYIVGGCVRDSIMGRKPKDWDIATSAKPEEVKVLFPRTCDTGLKHGTVTVLAGESGYEVTTFRIDGEYKDFRRPESVTYSDDIKDDLKRRDFTINAIAFNEEEGYIDPFGGMKDISDKVIRGVGEPAERFREDALRLLRAVRFSANLGFDIEKATSEALLENAELIKNISEERIREELFALLSAQYTEAVFTKEFRALIEHISAPLAESLARNEESLERLFEDCKNDRALRFSVLIYFLGDEDAAELIGKMKLSNRMRARIEGLHRVRNEKIGPEYYDTARKVFEWGEETFEDYLYIQMLGCIANDGGEANLDYVMNIEAQYRSITDNGFPIFIKDLAVNGYDLEKELKISGAMIGKTLRKLLDFVHNNPYKNTYGDLLREAYDFITKG